MDTRARTNPFPGLRPFLQDEADLFFGRDRQSDELVGRLASRRFLAVVGTSGSGKSSLVRAGLLPSLEGGFMAGAGAHWRMAILRPQDDPIGFLARAIVETGVLTHLDLAHAAAEGVIETTLRRSNLGLVEVARLAHLAPHENLLILVDQFEELFRFADLAKQRDAGDEASAFVKLLLEAARQAELPIYVIITMRSDFLGDCTRFRDLPEAISDSQYLIPRLTRDELQAVITGPIGVRSGRIAPNLVQRLLNDVGDDMDQLPVLQHALMRAWDHWERNDPDARPIELSDLEAIGGMAKALSIHAEEAYAELADDKRRNIARVAFQSLSGKDINSREARHPATVTKIAEVARVDPAAAIEIIDHFRRPGRAFLTPQADVGIGDGSMIDISHESLIRGWDRLRGWVEEEAEAAKIYRRLAEATSLHTEKKEGLWDDPALQLALDWRDKWKPNTDWAQRYDPHDHGFTQAMDFLDQSRHARDELRRAEKRRRIRVLVGTAATACIVATLGIFAGWKWYQADAALAEILQTQDLYLASLADQWTQAGDTEAALPLALEILPDASAHSRRIYYPQAEYQLAIAIRHLHERLVVSADTDPILSAAMSPDGKRIVTASAGGAARIWNAETGKLDIEVVTPERSAVNDASFSSDGKLIITASDDGLVRLWDVAKGTNVELKGHKREVRSAAFDADARRVVTASADGTACIWDIRTLNHVCTPDFEKREMLCAVFSHDGRRVVTGSASGEVRIWNADTMMRVETQMPMQHDDRVTGVAYSRDGHYIVTSSLDRTALLWDAETGGKVRSISVGASVESVAISPDGQRIVTASADNVAQIWDAATGKPVGERFITEAKQQAMRHVAFSFDGDRVVTASDDGTARVWNVDAPINGPLLLRGHRGVVRSAAFSPDGKRIVTASEDSTARIWDAATGGRMLELDGHMRGVLDASFSRNGKYIVTASADGSARIWDADTGHPLGEPLKAEPGDVNTASFSPDGKQIVTAYENGSAWIWNAETRKRIGPLGADAHGVRSAVFSRDGRQILTAHRDGTARTWSAQTGTLIAHTPGGGVALRSAAYGPDGKLIVTTSADGTMQIWNSRSLTSRFSKMIGTGILYGAVFSPDGRRILTASKDGEARLLDAETGQLIDEPFKHGGDVRGAAFDPDGKRIVTASADRIARVWPVFENTQALIHFAKSIAPRCLMRSERQSILLLPPEPDSWCKKMKKWPYRSD